MCAFKLKHEWKNKKTKKLNTINLSQVKLCFSFSSVIKIALKKERKKKNSWALGTT